MDIWDLLSLAGLVYVAYRVGQLTILWPIKRAMEETAAREGKTLEQLAERILSERDQSDSEEVMRVERVEGQYFAYGDTLGFLAQGSSFRDMFSRIKQRYPGYSFRIKDYQAEFSEEESGRMVRAVFDVFGEQNEQDKRG